VLPLFFEDAKALQAFSQAQYSSIVIIGVYLDGRCLMFKRQSGYDPAFPDLLKKALFAFFVDEICL
jgi:hypothetical protein